MQSCSRGTRWKTEPRQNWNHVECRMTFSNEMASVIVLVASDKTTDILIKKTHKDSIQFIHHELLPLSNKMNPIAHCCSLKARDWTPLNMSRGPRPRVTKPCLE
jgi:hypothetical protein